MRNRVEHGAFLVARTLAGLLSEKAAAGLGGYLGDLFALLGRRRQRILRFNLEHALGELSADERKRLERQVARHFGRVALDALRVRRLEPDRLLAAVKVVGRENLEGALAGGRGALLLSAHFGSWEVAALVAGLLLPRGLAVVNRPLDNPLLEAELERFRSRFGNRSLGKRSVARDILRELKEGGAVGILIDQRPSAADGVAVPFFGWPTPTHPIIAQLALRTGAPVVPIWGLWDSPGRYTVRFDPPLQAAPGEDEASLTARLVAAIEAIIRERPEQWLWYHDRWRAERVTQLR